MVMKKIIFTIVILVSLGNITSVASTFIDAKASCNKGNAKSCYDLAGMYYRGENCERDIFKTKELMAKACNGGYIKACNLVGQFYKDDSLQTKKNEQKALKFFHKACEAGDAESCGEIGFIYEDNKSINKNLEKAYEFYERACTLGDYGRCVYLGTLYAEKNNFKALKFFKKGCEGKLAGSCMTTAYMYHLGKGVRQNTLTAKEYYGKACDFGDEKGCQNYAELNQ